MSWEIGLQVFTGCLAGIGGWFLYDLVREFKSFKTETKNDVFSLKQERATFQTAVNDAKLSISVRVLDMQKVHNEFTTIAKQSMNELKAELTYLRQLTEGSAKKAENFEAFLKKSLELSRALNERLKAQERELQNLRVVIGDTTILKSGK